MMLQECQRCKVPRDQAMCPFVARHLLDRLTRWQFRLRFQHIAMDAATAALVHGLIAAESYFLHRGGKGINYAALHPQVNVHGVFVTGIEYEWFEITRSLRVCVALVFDVYADGWRAYPSVHGKDYGTTGPITLHGQLFTRRQDAIVHCLTEIVERWSAPHYNLGEHVTATQAVPVVKEIIARLRSVQMSLFAEVA
jgi:hypothetical protein